MYIKLYNTERLILITYLQIVMITNMIFTWL